MQSTESNKHIHQGRNIKRFREMLGLKQETLAYELGDDWSQKRVSMLESKETVEDSILGQIAQILKVPVEAIENFDEQAAVTYFNTFNDNSFSNAQGTFSPSHCTFNALDKMVKLFEENKKLYERLLASEREKVEILKNK